MNIGIDLRALTHGIISGVTTYLEETLNELVKIDKQNHYYLWWNSRSDLPKISPPQFDNPRFQLIVTRYSNISLNFKFQFQGKPKLDQLLLTKIRKGHEKMDLFWLPDPRPIALSDNCQLVTTIHDLSSELYPQFFSLKTRLWLKLLNPANLAHRSSQILTVSDSTATDLRKIWRIPRHKISITHLGVRGDLKRVSKVASKKVREKYDLPPHFILSLSALEPRKNLKTLIQAFAKLKRDTDLPHQLVLAGQPDSTIFASPKIKKYDWLHLPGFISESDKSALLSAAECFCFPSFYEGFGLPILEAMKCGTPVLAADIPALREVAGAAAIFIDPSNPNAWQIGIQRVLSESKTLKKFRKLGLAQAKNFTWRETAKKTLKTFEKLGHGKFISASLHNPAQIPRSPSPPAQRG